MATALEHLLSLLSTAMGRLPEESLQEHLRRLAELIDEWAEYANSVWPNPDNSCYDCGSTIPGRHTPLCDMAPEDSHRDLPQRDPKYQGWAGCYDRSGKYIPPHQRPTVISTQEGYPKPSES